MDADSAQSLAAVRARVDQLLGGMRDQLGFPPGAAVGSTGNGGAAEVKGVDADDEHFEQLASFKPRRSTRDARLSLSDLQQVQQQQEELAATAPAPLRKPSFGSLTSAPPPGRPHIAGSLMEKLTAPATPSASGPASADDPLSRILARRRARMSTGGSPEGPLTEPTPTSSVPAISVPNMHLPARDTKLETPAVDSRRAQAPAPHIVVPAPSDEEAGSSRHGPVMVPAALLNPGMGSRRSNARPTLPIQPPPLPPSAYHNESDDEDRSSTVTSSTANSESPAGRPAKSDKPTIAIPFVNMPPLQRVASETSSTHSLPHPRTELPGRGQPPAAAAAAAAGPTSIPDDHSVAGSGRTSVRTNTTGVPLPAAPPLPPPPQQAAPAAAPAPAKPATPVDMFATMSVVPTTVKMDLWSKCAIRAPLMATGSPQDCVRVNAVLEPLTSQFQKLVHMMLNGSTLMLLDPGAPGVAPPMLRRVVIRCAPDLKRIYLHPDVVNGTETPSLCLAIDHITSLTCGNPSPALAKLAKAYGLSSSLGEVQFQLGLRLAPGYVEFVASDRIQRQDLLVSISFLQSLFPIVEA